MRWQYRDPALVWLLVPAYLCHLAEELLAGFPEWTALVVGQPLPRGAFLVINAVAIVVMVAAIRAATQREDYGWMAIAIATILVVNALAHLLGSLLTGTYSPGLITAIAFYVPLGLLVLLRAWHQAAPRAFARGILVGLIAHAIVFVVAFAATRS